MASSSSCSSSLTYGWKYHVFISFRGVDTRWNFAGYLYDALCRSGIKTFFDDEELEKGDELNDTLFKAIRDSMIGLIIFSKNYASSTWCLEELTKIMEYSKDEAKHMSVVPVFYLINPADLRHQTGSIAEALAKHEERFIDKTKIQKWREALKDVAGLIGWHLKSGETYEHKFINNIVESVHKKISRLLYSDQNAAQHDNQWQQYSQPTQQLMSITPIPAQPVYPSSSSYHTSVPLPPQSQQSVPDLSNDLSSLAISGATSHASYTTSPRRIYSLPTFQSSQRQYHQPVQQPTSRLLGSAYPTAPSSHQTSVPKPFEHPIPMHRRKKPANPQPNNNITNQGQGAQHLPDDEQVDNKQVQPSGHTIPSSNAGISTSKSQQRQQPKSSTHGSVPRGKMHIFFETLSKEKIMVAVESSNTVHEVKAMIMTEKGIPIHQQRLVYQGRQLDDGYTLADYNIQNESVVYLVLRI